MLLNKFILNGRKRTWTIYDANLALRWRKNEHGDSTETPQLKET